MKKSSSTSVLVALLASLSFAAKAQTVDQAFAFERQGNLGEAAEVWRAVTQRNPQDAGAFAQLGVILAIESKTRAAEFCC